MLRPKTKRTLLGIACISLVAQACGQPNSAVEAGDLGPPGLVARAEEVRNQDLLPGVQRLLSPQRSETDQLVAQLFPRVYLSEESYRGRSERAASVARDGLADCYAGSVGLSGADATAWASHRFDSQFSWADGESLIGPGRAADRASDRARLPELPAAASQGQQRSDEAQVQDLAPEVKPSELEPAPDDLPDDFTPLDQEELEEALAEPAPTPPQDYALDEDPVGIPESEAVVDDMPEPETVLEPCDSIVAGEMGAILIVGGLYAQLLQSHPGFDEGPLFDRLNDTVSKLCSDDFGDDCSPDLVESVLPIHRQIVEDLVARGILPAN